MEEEEDWAILASSSSPPSDRKMLSLSPKLLTETFARQLLIMLSVSIFPEERGKPLIFSDRRLLRKNKTFSLFAGALKGATKLHSSPFF